MGKKNHSTVPELPLGEINIIPIVDVSFCLVIFCLVAMNIMLTAGINVLEAKTGARTGKAAAQDNVAVTLTQDNRILVNNSEIPSSDLSVKLLALLPQTKDQMVLITAHETNRCEQVVDVLDIAKKCGAQRLVLMNNPLHGPAQSVDTSVQKPVEKQKHTAKAKKRKRHA